MGANMRTVVVPGVLAVFLAAHASVSAQEKIDFKVVKYAGLTETVKSLRGKVVVVDFWATYCAPCMKKFPHLVEMHRRYAKDGLAVVSVSIDRAARGGASKAELAKVDASILKFLKSQGATFTNLVLDEPADVLEKKLHFAEIPTVFIFSRQGKWTQLTSAGDKNVDPSEIEAKVVKLLKDK